MKTATHKANYCPTDKARIDGSFLQGLNLYKDGSDWVATAGGTRFSADTLLTKCGWYKLNSQPKPLS